MAKITMHHTRIMNAIEETMMTLWRSYILIWFPINGLMPGCSNSIADVVDLS